MNLDDLKANEMALVGSVLYQPDMFDKLLGVIGPQFLDETYGKLFDLARDLYDQGKGIDVRTLLAEVRKSKIDLTAGDLGDVFNAVPNASNAPFYAKMVTDAYRRRRLKMVGDMMTWRSSDPSDPVDEIIADAEGKIRTLEQSDESFSVSVSEASEKCYDDLFRTKRDPSMESVPTGFADLDHETGGLRPGEMTVLAARPGCGKTSLAMQVAEHAASRGRHTLFASLEMGENELIQRSVTSRTGIPSRDLRAGVVSERYEKDVKKSLIEMSALELTFFVPPKATLKQIRAAARLQKSRTGLSFLAIDYLGLIRPDGKSQGKYEDVTLISNEIKSLARELRIPILVLCQLNREAEGKQPMLSHLRDSGAIEQDADSVLFLEPHDWAAQNKVDFNLIMAKSRHGRTFKTELKFEGSRTRFLPSNYNSEFSEFT